MNTLRSDFIAWYFNEFKFDPLFVVMDGMAEDSPWHREDSIGIHTNMVVTEFLSRCDDHFDMRDVVGAFACAFHDVGKPGACEFKWKESRGDYKSFNGHELLSARLWEDWAARNWDMISSRFGFDPEDIYRVSWLIEHHKPWELKNPAKLDNLLMTATNAVSFSTFRQMVTADTWGRLSDDASDKRAKVAAWVDALEVREVSDTHDWAGGPEEIRLQPYEEGQPMLVVPIAPSGAGKSTVYRNGFPSMHSYSWDQLRLDWYSSDYNEAFRMSCDDKQFMNKVNAEFSRLIKARESIFVDNTNVSAKRRRFFTDQARRAGYHTLAILLPSTLQTVIDRQSTRDDKSVPSNAVERQYFGLQMPQLGEFDEIVVDMGNLTSTDEILGNI